MSAEIAKVSAVFPTALKVGVADGAKTNWPFVTKHTERQILDFYHAAEYLTNVADAQFARDPRARKQWLNDACSSLKHDLTGPQFLIEQMQGFLAEQKVAGREGNLCKSGQPSNSTISTTLQTTPLTRLPRFT